LYDITAPASKWRQLVAIEIDIAESSARLRSSLCRKLADAV